MMPQPKPQLLKGIRVADVSMHYAGPACTRALADMGAEVIKVESIQRPDIGPRRLVPADNDFGERWWEHSGYYIKRNINKYGVTLDLTRPQGVDVFKKLVKISDIVIENYTPRVMKHFGVDYAELVKVKPDIIMISLSGYGQTGPYRDRVALGPGLEASCGLASQTGYAGGPPSLAGLSYIDALSGMSGAAAIMVALVYRQRTGKGQYIDLSEQESMLPSMANAFMQYTMNGGVTARRGNDHSSFAPYGVFRCRGEEAWITIAITSDAEWDRLCQLMATAELSKEDQFATMLSRWEHKAKLHQVVERWTAGYDKHELMRLLQANGIAAGVVENGKDLLFDHHLHSRDFFHVVDHPEVGKRPYPNQFPVKFSEAEAREPSPAPTLGQHNYQVLHGLLELGDDEIKALETEGIIGTSPARVEQVKRRSWLQLDMMDQAGVIDFEPDYLEQLAKRFGQHVGKPEEE